MTAHRRPRTTIAQPASIDGTGLFTGQPCTVTFAPSEAGLTLKRSDIAAPVPIGPGSVDRRPIHQAFVLNKARSTNLACNHALAATVEHVLSAIAGLGITDCAIELDAFEMPILDGSARPFADALMQAGLAELDGGVEPITLNEPLKVEEFRGKPTITATPRSEPGWSITYELDYGPGALLDPQSASWDGTRSDYLQRIAPARTFCLENEANAMRSRGLFEGLTPADMLVIGKDGPIDNAYRVEHEPACHKLLDAIGDLALARRPIQADIVCHRSGHELNHRMAEALAKLGE